MPSTWNPWVSDENGQFLYNGELAVFDRSAFPFTSGGGGGGIFPMRDQVAQGAAQPTSNGGTGLNLNGLLNSLDGQDELKGMGDIFRTLLFLQGQRGGGNGQDSLQGLFSGIQL